MEKRLLMIFDNRYNLSKLLLLYAIIKLASIIDPITNDKCKDSNPIVVNSLDPCFCKTELAGGLTGAAKAAFEVFEYLFARPAEEGSRLVVTAASAGRQTHGGYMRAGAVQNYAPFIRNVDGIERANYIWKQLCGKLEQLQPGILANANVV
jgi:retinol dehydrogenase 12